MNNRKLLTPVFWILIITSVSAQDAMSQVSPVARAYLQQALDVMQQNALHKNEIDWKKVRDEALSMAKDVHTTHDT